jgi:HEAT repeat protein
MILERQRGVEQMTREVAARAIFDIGGAAATEALFGLLAEDSEAIAEVLGKVVASVGVQARTPLLGVLADASRPTRARLRAIDMLHALDANGVREPLRRLLGDKDAAVRLRSAVILADANDPAAIEPLIGLLGHADPNVQGAAAVTLARSPDGRAVAPLLGIVQGRAPKSTKVKALGALAATGDPRAGKALLGIVLKDDWALRIEALEALSGMQYEPAYKPLVDLYGKVKAPEVPRGSTDEALRHRAWRARHLKGRILRSFRTMKNTEAVELLLGMVQTFIAPPGRDGRGGIGWGVHGVSEALGAIGDPRAVEPIGAVLRSGRYRRKIGINYTARSAIGALSALGHPDAIDDLLWAAKNLRMTNPRTQALKAIGSIRHPRSVEVLVTLLADEAFDAGLKVGGVAPGLLALGEMAKPALLKLLLESPPVEKTAKFDPGHYAAELLGAMDDKALPELVKIAETDRRKHILGRAIEALRLAKDARALKPLTKLLADEDPEIRCWAAGGLGRTIMPGAVGILESAAKDPNTSVRRAVVWALETHRRRGEEFKP